MTTLAARAAAVTAALVGGTLAARAAQAPASPSPAFPARAEAVTVDVVVLDASGRPLAGLTRDDYRRVPTTFQPIRADKRSNLQRRMHGVGIIPIRLMSTPASRCSRGGGA